MLLRAYCRLDIIRRGRDEQLNAEREREREREEGHTVLRYSISLPSKDKEVLSDSTNPV